MSFLIKLLSNMFWRLSSGSVSFFTFGVWPSVILHKKPSFAPREVLLGIFGGGSRGGGGGEEGAARFSKPVTPILTKICNF